ncbi:MAG: hypothetical protein M0037_03015 [Betaproteobacteria bacterium]|nr:hypothetical protein [Betaproteobacteria bacterium]
MKPKRELAFIRRCAERAERERERRRSRRERITVAALFLTATATLGQGIIYYQSIRNASAIAETQHADTVRVVRNTEVANEIARNTAVIEHADMLHALSKTEVADKIANKTANEIATVVNKETAKKRRGFWVLW